MSCFLVAAAVAELPVVFAVQRHDGGGVLSDAGESEVDSPPPEVAVLPSEREQEWGNRFSCVVAQTPYMGTSLGHIWSTPASPHKEKQEEERRQHKTPQGLW